MPPVLPPPLMSTRPRAYDPCCLWGVQGVFFILATKAIPVPSVRVSSMCSTRVQGDDPGNSTRGAHRGADGSPGAQEHELSLGVSGGREMRGDGRGLADESGVERQGMEGDSRVDLESINKAAASGMKEATMEADRESVESQEAELPPKHWRCVVCKEVRLRSTRRVCFRG